MFRTLQVLRVLMTVLLAIMCCSHSRAQTVDPDAEKLYALVKNLPSFKDQIKGDKEQQFNKVYEQVLKDLPSARDEFSHLYTLSQLVLQLNDNHLYFYRVPPFNITRQSYTDSTFMAKYRSSDAFTKHLTTMLNVDSLYKAKRKAPADSVEGIYYINKDLTMALYRTAKRDSLIGVITNSRLPTWSRGQIAMILKEYTPNRFRAYRYDSFQRYWGLIANEKFMHNMLTESRWKKFPDQADYVNIAPAEPLFQFRSINKTIQYLRSGSFATGTSNLVTSQQFYNRIKDSLTAPTMIVDLRNNGGGGFKASAVFLALLKDYATKGRIMALINNRTYSNAEQFALRLKPVENVTLLGETTNGTLTYGNNTGITETLPSGIFKLYVTDMADYGNYLPYENLGIKPSVFLKADSDWVIQTQKYIESKSK